MTEDRAERIQAASMIGGEDRDSTGGRASLAEVESIRPVDELREMIRNYATLRDFALSEGDWKLAGRCESGMSRLGIRLYELQGVWT